MERVGHLCTKEQLFSFLCVVGADQDDAGSFKVAGSIVSFMGADQDFVIGADAVYFRGGQPCSLAVALRGTSYGTAVVVI